MMQATAISAAISPYSMAVAALVSSISRIFRMVNSPYRIGPCDPGQSGALRQNNLFEDGLTGVKLRGVAGGCAGGSAVRLRLARRGALGIGVFGGAAEIIALRLRAALVEQHLALRRGLDPLGDDRHVEAAPQPDDRADDRARRIVIVDRRDEALVDLDLVEGKGLEVRERRIAGAEIVDRDA